MIFNDLINNLALLVALSVVSGFINQRWHRSTRTGQLNQGLLFGFTAVLAMLNPLVFGPGVIFDGRSIMVSLAGFFFGPWAAILSAIITILYRVYLGGAGVLMGVLVILSSAGLGIIFYYRSHKAATLLNLLVFGVLVHVVMLALMFTLPSESALRAVLQIGPPVLLLYPLFTVIIGKVLNDQEVSHQDLVNLQQSEARQRLALEGASLGAWDWNIETGQTTFNERWAEMLGYSVNEIDSQLSAWQALVHPDDLARVSDELNAHITGKTPFYQTEHRLRHKNGSWVWVLDRGRVIERAPYGRARRASGTHLDITESKLIEEERELTVRLLRLLNLPNDLPELIREVTTLLKDWSGCEAVGIRLCEGDDYPYFETRGFPAAFVRSENSLCARSADGHLLRDEQGSPVLECMCGNVICGRFDPRQPFFTGHGSFWTNSTSDLLLNTTETDRQTRTRNRCNGEGYESVALIPLRAGGETLGLIQLNDFRRDRFQPAQIALFERLGESLAIALAQRKAQSALAERERDLERAQAIAHLGSWSWDPVTDRVEWSAEMCRIHGLTPDEFGKNITAVVAVTHPDDRTKQNKIFMDILAGQPGESYDFRVFRPDGSLRVVQVHGVQVDRDDSGMARRMFGVALDITEREQIEVAERQHSEQIKRLFEASQRLNRSLDLCEIYGTVFTFLTESMPVEGMLISAYDASSQMITCVASITPDGWEDISHFPSIPLEPEGMDTQSVAIRSGQALLVNDYQVRLRHTQTRYLFDDTNAELADAVPGDVSITRAAMLVPLKVGGQVVGVIQVFNYERVNVFSEENLQLLESLALHVASAQQNAMLYVQAQAELTERRWAERALRESEERYRTLVENVGEGIGFIDSDDIIAFANPAAEKIFGVPPGGLVGRPLNQFIGPEQIKLVLDRFHLRPEDGVFEVEVRIADGEQRTLLITVVPQRSEAGHMLGLFAVFRDVTEKKENDRLLERYRALAESSRDIMWFVRYDDGQIFEANQAACLAYGYSREELLELCIRDLRAPDTQAEISQLIYQASAEGAFFETLHRRKSGQVFPVEVSSRGATIGGERVLLSVIRDISERKRAEARIEDQLQRLSALQAIDNAIIFNMDLPVVLDVILKQVTEKLHVSGASIWLMDESKHQLHFAAGNAICACEQGEWIEMGQGRAGQVAARQSALWLPDMNQLGSGLCGAPAGEDGFRGYYGAPLISKGKLLGVLDVCQVEPLEVDAEWFGFVDMLAGQAAIAIDDTYMFTGLRQSNSELSQAYEATIEGWSRALDLRDQETEGHSQRVTDMSEQLARQFGFSEDELLQVRRGALLHDIGKMGVPDDILLKPDKLTPSEWKVMQRHPSYAYTLLHPIEFLRQSLDIPYCHHEKWDGSGYPRGLRGEAIPLSARIFAIIDVWDALTSDRPYRPAWTSARARAYIQEQSGKHFDPRVVEAFLSLAYSLVGTPLASGVE